MTSDVGTLSQRFQFFKRPLRDDGMGNKETAWREVPDVECAAEVTARFGGEAIVAARLQGRQPVTIRVRASSETREINPDWKAKDKRTGVEFNIRSGGVDPFLHTSDRGRFLDFLAESGVVT